MSLGEVDILGIVQNRTERAALVKVLEVDGCNLHNPKTVWFPISQCDGLDGSVVEDEIEFTCPEWLAEEKDLV